MSPTVWLVTGASRGIGLETVRQLAAKQNVRVVAGARDPAASEGLQELVKASDGRVATVVLDVTSEESIAAAVEATKATPFVASNGTAIDVLYLNAGTMSSGWKAASKVSAAELRTDSDTNFIATALTTLAFLPLLQASPATTAPAKVIHISSLLASASLLPTLGKWASVAACYSASKAAAVMWLRKLASEIADGSAGVGREGGWVVGMIHPGRVSTSMTRGNGDIEVDESVRGVLSVVESLTEAESGCFKDWQGNALSF